MLEDFIDAQSADLVQAFDHRAFQRGAVGGFILDRTAQEMNGVVQKVGAGPEQVALKESVKLQESIGNLSRVVLYAGKGLPQVLNNPGSSPDQGHGQPGGLFQIEGHLRNFSTGHGFKPLLMGKQGVPEKAIKGCTDRQGKTTSGAAPVRKKLTIEQLIT